MKWIRKKSKKKDLINFNKDFKSSKIINNVLNNYKFDTYNDLTRFLNPTVKYFYNPFLMKGMKKSIKSLISPH